MMLKAKALTPVHIGTGNKLLPFSMLQDGGTVKVLGIDRLAEEFKDEPDRLTKAIENRKLLDGDLREKALKTAQYSLARHVNDLGNWEALECIKDTHHDAYLPGSSIKGAIRTALLFAFASVFAKKRPEIFEEGHNLGGLRTKFEKLLTSENENEKMRHLKIGDSSATKNIGLHKSLILSLKQNNRLEPKPMSIYLEAIEKGEEFTMHINTKNFDFSGNLATFCNQFSSAIIENELKFYGGYAEEKAAAHYRDLKRMSDSMIDKKQFLLRVGWGCGNTGTSLNLRLPPEIRAQVARDSMRANPAVFPKTRRMSAEDRAPFGWLLCTLEE